MKLNSTTKMVGKLQLPKSVWHTKGVAIKPLLNVKSVIVPQQTTWLAVLVFEEGNLQ